MNERKEKVLKRLKELGVFHISDFESIEDLECIIKIIEETDSQIDLKSIIEENDRLIKERHKRCNSRSQSL